MYPSLRFSIHEHGARAHQSGPTERRRLPRPVAIREDDDGYGGGTCRKLVASGKPLTPEGKLLLRKHGAGA